MRAIEIDHLSKTYPDGKVALAGVDLGIDPTVWRVWRDEHQKALAETQPAATPPATGGP